MARADEIPREYSKPDDVMLEQAQVMHNLLNADLADFTALFTFIDAAFVTSFQSAITTADAIPIGDDELGNLGLLTIAVEAALEDCRVQYQKLLTYARLLYPNSPVPNTAFRQHRYEKDRNSQTKMVDLMQSAYSMANSAEFSADLIAAGFTQAEIDKLDTLGQALRTANLAQEDFRAGLVTKTRTRIFAYNAVWNYMRQVSQASKLVYADNAAKQKQYLLYPENSSPTLPSKVQNLQYDVGNTKLTWDVAANADYYSLEAKRNAPEFDWEGIYDGPATEFTYVPEPGDWLFRCRGENDGGVGEWSDELSYTQV